MKRGVAADQRRPRQDPRSRRAGRSAPVGAPRRRVARRVRQGAAAGGRSALDAAERDPHAAHVGVPPGALGRRHRSVFRELCGASRRAQPVRSFRCSQELGLLSRTPDRSPATRRSARRRRRGRRVVALGAALPVRHSVRRRRASVLRAERIPDHRHPARASASESDRAGALRAFYIRRALRIFPAFYLTLALAWWADLPLVRESLAWHAAYLSNVYTFVRGEWPGAISHFWSLAVEEQFYLVWPWLIVFAPRRWLVPGIVAAIVVGAALPVVDGRARLQGNDARRVDARLPGFAGCRRAAWRLRASLQAGLYRHACQGQPEGWPFNRRMAVCGSLDRDSRR